MCTIPHILWVFCDFAAGIRLFIRNAGASAVACSNLCGGILPGRRFESFKRIMQRL
jgi:hypothetical protein